MDKIALFPGSFDPFTLGHLDILKSALKLFDKVIIGIGYNISKTGFFSIEERLDIVCQSIKGIENVSVECYRGLTIDFCKSISARFIIRGLRTTTDFELERVVAQANSKMAPDIITVFIPSGTEYSFISSTVVRDLIANGGDITPFMAKGVIINKKADDVR